MQQSISRSTERPREPVPPTPGDTICHAPRRMLAGLSLAAAWLRSQQRGWRYEKLSLFVTSGCARGHLTPDVAGRTAKEGKTEPRVCWKVSRTNRINVIVKFCLENVSVICEKYLQMVADAGGEPTSLQICVSQSSYSYRSLCVCLALDICRQAHENNIDVVCCHGCFIFLFDFLEKYFFFSSIQS